MKKLLMVFTFALMLSGCTSSDSPTATVKDMYDAALNQDSQTFEKINSQNDKMSRHYEEALIGFGDIAHTAGGTDKMEFKELKKKDMQENVVEQLDSRYENGWTMVMVKSKEENPFFWVLDKADDNYYVLEGESASEESVLN